MIAKGGEIVTTPIYDFLKRYITLEETRFHMPGHKGNLPVVQEAVMATKLLNEISQYDITEISGADELYQSEGIIAQAEENTARLYGAKHTSFSAGGSTLCIQAMLRLAANQGETIIAARNVHASFVNTCALLDIMPFFVQPKFNDNFYVSGEIEAEAIENAIRECPQAKAVYITSPDYLGCISDVKAIAEVCHRYELPLVVDNAHGAHLKFMPKDIHPITLGADLCCDSAHKTLPVFTGGAYLHVSPNSNITKEQVKSAMGLFGSTSPSYLIMLSLDFNNLYLAAKAKEDFKLLESKVKQLETILQAKGFSSIGKQHDITKITLDAYSVGMTGDDLKRWLKQYYIEPEYAASRHVVLMVSPQNKEHDFEKLIEAISAIKPNPFIISPITDYQIPKQIQSIRTAVFSQKKCISVDKAEGRVAAEVKIKCPPGVPIILPGEIIDKHTQKIMKKSSIFTINVVE